MSTMCRVLDVSISGYYAWIKRPPCTRQREDGELTQRLVRIFHQHSTRLSELACFVNEDAALIDCHR